MSPIPKAMESSLYLQSEGRLWSTGIGLTASQVSSSQYLKDYSASSLRLVIKAQKLEPGTLDPWDILAIMGYRALKAVDWKGKAIEEAWTLTKWKRCFEVVFAVSEVERSVPLWGPAAIE